MSDHESETAELEAFPVDGGWAVNVNGHRIEAIHGMLDKAMVKAAIRVLDVKDDDALAYLSSGSLTPEAGRVKVLKELEVAGVALEHAHLSAGSSVKDHCRVAILRESQDAVKRTIYAHLPGEQSDRKDPSVGSTLSLKASLPCTSSRALRIGKRSSSPCWQA